MICRKTVTRTSLSGKNDHCRSSHPSEIKPKADAAIAMYALSSAFLDRSCLRRLKATAWQPSSTGPSLTSSLLFSSCPVLLLASSSRLGKLERASVVRAHEKSSREACHALAGSHIPRLTYAVGRLTFQSILRVVPGTTTRSIRCVVYLAASW